MADIATEKTTALMILGDELDSLHARLKGIREFRGVLTSKTRKDINRIVASLCDLHVLTEQEGFSLRVDEFTGLEQAEFLGIPETAAQLMAIVEQKNSSPALNWAMRKPVDLAVVFSDITGSAVLSQQLGDSNWQEILRKHFTRARNLAEKNGGIFVNDIGDGLMALFYEAESALDFTMERRDAPADSHIAVHQGAHIGKVLLKPNNAVGTTVDLANRVTNVANRGQIVVTDAFRDNIRRIKSAKHAQLKWKRLPETTLKGFAKSPLWQV